MIIDIQALANGLGVTKPGLYVLLIAIATLLYVIYKDLPARKQKNRLLVTIAVTIMIILWLTDAVFTGSTTFVPGRPLVANNWQEEYLSEAQMNLVRYDDYVADTEYYNYEDSLITMIATGIASESSDSLEAIQKTAEYVYQNVEYVSESDQVCFTTKASEVLSSGTGQCDTQSIAIIAILRKMGIAAQPVGGCIIVNPACRLQSFAQSIGVIKRVPQYEELNGELSGQSFSRTGGGLHAWAVAWVPDKGWVNIESTAGILADTNCYYYHVELYPDNDDQRSICVSTDYQYAMACNQADLKGLDDYGLGLANEVNPK